MGTEIRKCDCLHSFQDNLYGKTFRLHNVGGTKLAPKYRCTICRKEKTK